jgi:DegV family protein with EDD domain
LAVKIITDSTAYLDRKLLKEFDITEVSMTVDLEDGLFAETDLINEEFYQLIAGKEKLPTTSQPSPLVLYQNFLNLIKQGHEILCVLISSDLSGTYYSAVQAQKMVLEEIPEARIEIIDSHTTVMQLGLAALTAARTAREGASFEQVIKKTKAVLSRSKLFFIPKTLEYLKRGGRIGEAASLLGTLLQVKPILTVTGPVTVYEKVRTFEKAVKQMLQMVENDAQTYGIQEIAVHHINCAAECEQLIINKVKDKTEKEILVSPIGPVIGLHVGPGTLGIAYVLKER